jgi:ATP-dependent RNA helicase RhlE
LLDLLSDKSIDLSHVEVLVLDEADRMCDMGFLPDIRRILKTLPARRQTLFFSATMPDEIRDLADRLLDDPVTVQIGMTAPVETVSHALYPVPHKLKKNLLLATLEQTATGRVLVFTRTKYRARNLARDLEKRGYRVSAPHVINFDMPDTVDAYTHRIGRTGRAHKTGEAYTFVVQEDEPLVRKIEKVLGARIEWRRLPDFDYNVSVLEGQPRQTHPDQRRGRRPNRETARRCSQ